MTIHKDRFKDKLPDRIARLEELAFDIWWSWQKDARDLWKAFDLPLWYKTNHNPVRMIEEVSIERLIKLAQDPAFLIKYDSVIYQYDRAKDESNTWFATSYPHLKNKTIAYLSTEFAVHHSLPIYSGGLGVLSGDHIKEASDLGIPLIAVGFMYAQGYFTQTIDPDGSQQAVYETTDYRFTALQSLKDPGEPEKEFIISIPLGERTVKARVWHLKVGRVPLFLLDTDVSDNAPEDKQISYRLYDSDRDLRIRQEIVLGIGSVRLLRELNIHPDIWHINEGHVGFALIELLREKIAEGYSPTEAKKLVREKVAFTTHTPVPAGHEEFDLRLVKRYLERVWKEMGITEKEFLDLGIYAHGTGKFNMTMLSLSLSSIVNGVSQLNAEVMNNNLKPLWTKIYDEPPVIGITNGVHVSSWVAGEMQELFKRYIDTNWLQKQDDPSLWERVYDIPDRDLWSVRQQLKSKMFTYIRDRARYKWGKGKITAEQTIASGVLLDENILTIGFARRFAPYKRATLLFRDIERLKKIINNPYRPVQFIFSGKSHPANEEGKRMIKEIYQHALDPEFRGRIVFLEDYGLNVARFLVQGVDVWLNNPRRPLEASGTSGQKAAMNGVPNFSVRDGWWYEGYNGRNGWEIGSTTVTFDNIEEQDEFDARSLYNVLENEIIPLYYQQDKAGIPRHWLEVVRESIKTAMPQYSTRRMLKEYTTRIYKVLLEKNL
ncbi:MAG: alpha-glucan family phosphorylase [Candidatus Heimdallarchaeaceae archaeon]